MPPRLNTAKPNTTHTWTNRAVKIEMQSGSHQWVQAKVLADVLAVYEVPYNEKRRGKTYTFEHIESGATMMKAIASDKPLYRICETLVQHCLKSLQCRTRETVRANLPTWVQPWLRECWKAEAWHEPTQEERLPK